MKPYDIINIITEDIISNSFNDDYCFLYFPDNIRYNHALDDPRFFLYDKHNCAGNYREVDFGAEIIRNPFRDSFFHSNKWLHGTSLQHQLRRHTNNNFYQHSWEPIYFNYDKVFWDYVLKITFEKNTPYDPRTGIVLHSEKNSRDLLDIEQHGIKHVHWFAHAYICSEFYFKHYQKFNMVTEYKQRPIRYNWISANRLLRQHRVDLLEMIDLTKGCYSLLNPDPNGLKYKGPVASNSFDDHTNSSADIWIDSLTPWNTSFLHVVSETVWQDKIHFTEKIFKPIVLHQPFVVVQAPGSLEYLQSYGFKTFDKWWDESYDKIQDPKERMKAIATIIDDIGSKDIKELETLRMEMADVLEHNFRHFYENIPAIVLGELKNNIRLLS